jgi:hypothetical protein
MGRNMRVLTSIAMDVPELTACKRLKSRARGSAVRRVLSPLHLEYQGLWTAGQMCVSTTVFADQMQA